MNRTLMAGLGVVGAFLAAVIFALNATHGMPVKERTTLEAEFDDVSGLAIGDDVRIASARVGYVDAMKIENGRALLALKIDNPGRKVYADATAVVTDRSAFGQKFVNINPGTPQAGESNGRIVRARTVRAQDINELFNVFDEKTRSAANTTLSQLGGGMTGHAQDLNDLLGAAPGILDDTAEVSNALAVNQANDFVGLLRSSNQLAARFRAREQHVADALDQLGTVLDAAAVDDGAPLGETIQDAPETLDELEDTLHELEEPLDHTASAMEQLRPGAEALADATPDLRAFMKDAVDPLRDVPRVAKLGVPAVESLTDLVHDARPLARQLIKTGSSGAPPTGILADYEAEVVRWFTDLGGMLDYDTEGGKYLRFLLEFTDESLGGKGKAIGVQRNVYGAPGTTDDAGDQS